MLLRSSAAPRATWLSPDAVTLQCAPGVGSFGPSTPWTPPLATAPGTATLLCQGGVSPALVLNPKP